MSAIKHILTKLLVLLKPLGAWGLFAMGGIDSAVMGLPGGLDLAVAGYVYANPSRAWLYVLMASAGSALGCMMLYGIGYAGGEMLLEKRMSPAKFQRARDSFDHHPFLALMVPAILPPPFPFKIVVLAAAVFEMHILPFLGAIFAGRIIRFSILSVLTVKFGPDIVKLTTSLVHQHLTLTLTIIAAAIAAWFIVRRMRRSSVVEVIS